MSQMRPGVGRCVNRRLDVFALWKTAIPARSRRKRIFSVLV